MLTLQHARALGKFTAPLLFLVIASCRSGTSLATASGDRAPDVLRPGAAEINVSHLATAKNAYRMMVRMHPDSADREAGRGETAVRTIDHAGAAAVLLVSAFGKPGQFTDTALVVRSTLAPVWETMHLGNSTTRFDYDGAVVRVAKTTPDSGTRTVEHSYDVPVFHFNELDVLIRSLPYRVGYNTILPLYSEGSDALEMDTVRVMSKSADNVWTIRFADPAIVATYEVSASTREIVRYEFIARRNGSRVRRERIPADR